MRTAKVQMTLRICIIWAPSWENPRGHLQTACANNKGADQLRSLINAFVVRYLESMLT